MTRLDLEKIRLDIDALDSRLVQVLEERMNTVLAVAAYKDEHNMPVLDRERELKVIAKAVGRLENPQYAAALQQVMEKVMEVSRNLQIDILAKRIKEREQCSDPICIGYQGVKGSFSHEALEGYFDKVPKVEMNYVHFEDVVVAVKKGEVKYGVLPIENSSTGGITEVYDLVRKYDCSIVGEKCVKVEQNLLALPGAALDKIRQVYSHPQGFEQSRGFFKKYPAMELIPFFNTAKSAKMVSESGDITMAAVASKQAAKLYGLQVLAENINFNSANHTRFIIIANKPEHRPDANKITVVVAVKHEPGSLYKTLGTFYSCGLNMVNLESRPLEGRSWEYFFHIDLTGNLAEPSVQQALHTLSDNCAYCKVLGNYVAENVIK